MLTTSCAVENRYFPSINSDKTVVAVVEPVRGVLLRQKGGRLTELSYYLYVPRHLNRQQIPLVSVHGISRNAREHGEALMAFSENSGRILIAPIFSRKRFRGYQRIEGENSRADQALVDMLEKVAALTGVSTEKVDLFGFSGGAQFSHRFAMLHPSRVNKLMLSSAGWYTFPHRDQPYPYGTSTEDAMGVSLNQRMQEFLVLPMLVMVGEGDIRRDRQLRKGKQIDMLQGLTRVERAARWVRENRSQARLHKISPQMEYKVLPKCGHSFSDCVDTGGLATTIEGWLSARENEEVSASVFSTF